MATCRRRKGADIPSFPEEVDPDSERAKSERGVSPSLNVLLDLDGMRLGVDVLKCPKGSEEISSSLLVSGSVPRTGKMSPPVPVRMEYAIASCING
jgi:hypothetical protein